MKSSIFYRASAPGSIMLFGEHAVLHGSAAIASAISARITVTLTPRTDDGIFIHSEVFPTYAGDRHHLVPTQPYHFVLAALNTVLLTTGCDIHIVSELSPTVGLGSSAAVTVATLAVLHAWQQQPLSQQALAQQARQIIRERQGVGSGTDAVASVYGGIVYYQAEPWHVEPLPLLPEITLCYSGYKTKTADVIAQIAKKQQEQPLFYENLYKRMAVCVDSARDALQEQNLKSVGKLMTQHHDFQKALGTSDTTLEALVERMQQQPTILGAKISGSGLGDCIVGLGSLHKDVGAQQLFVQCTSQGVLLHDN